MISARGIGRRNAFAVALRSSRLGVRDRWVTVFLVAYVALLYGLGPVGGHPRWPWWGIAAASGGTLVGVVKGLLVRGRRDR